MTTILKISLLFAFVMATQAYVRVCYYTNWSQYRSGLAKYELSRDYQDGLCTHLIFSFGKVVSSGNGYTIAPYEWNDQSVLYKEMQDLKKRDSGLKTLLAIGGWTHGSEGFKQMVSTKANRDRFVINSLRYIKQYGFDGLDIDWEFPAARGSPAGDRQRFSSLCKELADAYHREGLLVTAAVKAAANAVYNNYEVAEISRSLDFINLMTYDLYGSWDNRLGHHTNTDENARPENIHYTVKQWLDQGASPDKLVLGLASYGRSFTLKNNCQINPGTPATSGSTGPHTREKGFLAYYEICKMNFQNHVCTESSPVKAPYGSSGDQWVGYDDQQSIVYKIHNVMKKHNLKGYMFWALDLDDFSGKFCGQGKYPLMNAAKVAALGGNVAYACTNKNACGSPPPRTTQPPKSTTRSTATTTTRLPPKVSGKCKAIPPYSSISGFDAWCNQGNNGMKYKRHCTCN
ncbi:chitinase-3-like protein 1 [Clytia hemisphaerica]|uniref:GH18 domain-containing protein n=1 Tax=Clytia hemisphaerica TaxID=252671 RepID=A0A7M5WLI1_9CNID